METKLAWDTGQSPLGGHGLSATSRLKRCPSIVIKWPPSPSACIGEVYRVRCETRRQCDLLCHMIWAWFNFSQTFDSPFVRSRWRHMENKRRKLLINKTNIRYLETRRWIACLFSPLDTSSWIITVVHDAWLGTRRLTWARCHLSSICSSLVFTVCKVSLFLRNCRYPMNEIVETDHCFSLKTCFQTKMSNWFRLIGNISFTI